MVLGGDRPLRGAAGEEGKGEMNMNLKDTLWEAIRGPGGITEVLSLLCQLSREMAKDQREIMQDERRARIWEKVAQHLNEASGKSLPLSELEK
jgi:hypothetical protein